MDKLGVNRKDNKLRVGIEVEFSFEYLRTNIVIIIILNMYIMGEL